MVLLGTLVARFHRDQDDVAPRASPALILVRQVRWQVTPNDTGTAIIHDDGMRL